jgi:hypothetical protein
MVPVVGFEPVDCTAEQKLSCHQEILVDVVEEVFEVGVYTRLRINSLHISRQQVVKLHNPDGNGFVFLRVEHLLAELDVSNQRITHHLIQII